MMGISSVEMAVMTAVVRKDVAMASLKNLSNAMMGMKMIVTRVLSFVDLLAVVTDLFGVISAKAMRTMNLVMTVMILIHSTGVMIVCSRSVAMA